MEKLKYLDGLRGLAALAVVAFHFLYVFYPDNVSYGQAAGNPVVHAMAESPLGLLFQGHFAVCLFFVLSGYVLSFKYLSSGNPEWLKSGAARRYVRLAVPMAFSVLVSWVLLHFHLFANAKVGQSTGSEWFAGFWRFDANAAQAVFTALYGVFFQADASYNVVLWTMHFELYGSFLVYAVLALLAGSKRRWIWYAVLLILLRDTYYLAFLSGLILCDLHISLKRAGFGVPKWAFLPILLCGLYLGSFSYYSFDNRAFWLLLHLGVPDGLESERQLYNIIGAFCVLAAILVSPALKRSLSAKMFGFLGDVSFSLYLLHMLFLGTVSCWIFTRLHAILPYGVSFLLTFGLSIAPLLFLSYGMFRLIDRNAVKLSSYLYRKLLRVPARTVAIPGIAGAREPDRHAYRGRTRLSADGNAGRLAGGRLSPSDDSHGVSDPGGDKWTGRAGRTL
ncbi:acyltransferase family protein [Paenibacillus humicola]|uniref:acyltransferase family protein n=1 Tax=Paenibacillus humicola TaxID=3110540 RepID=UPI00237BBB0B|nr:acyltransferase [Paenibacillus humicola]